MTALQNPELRVGSTLGRYVLVEPIGSGGMGQVWKAHDANLDRVVAIKLLHGERGDSTSRERFRREALVLSRLSHPGVATIFDFDSKEARDFLVMEYVPGGTLAARIAAGSLAIDEIMKLGGEIADALDAAHRSGFVHRDLKPANIMITEHGHAKILDFGIALLMAAGHDSGRITKPGMALGSLSYMSPEQLFGDGDDARTDIYSLGVMLFEMVTGKVPFIRDRPESLMFAIINTAPPLAKALRPDMPADLARLIDQCLQKDHSQRPASAADVAIALRMMRTGERTGQLATQVRSRIKAIAVLPLRNVSNDSSQEYFVGGMTEAIISDLSRIQALRVISRTSAMKYKDSALSLPEIARELNVDAVLEGSALLVGNKVRVNVQLVSSRDEETLWSSRYDRDLENVLELQSELSETVAREIAIKLTPGEARQLTAARGAVHPEAHIEYLKSRHSSFAGSREGVDLGIRHAKRALEFDPEFALAWAALADCHIFRAVRGMAPPAASAAEAMSAAKRALELDPSLADAHSSIGLVLSVTGDVYGGIRELEKAIELNPGLAFAHNMLGRAYCALERYPEALAAVQKSISLDPLSVLIHTGLGDTYYYGREYEKSVLAYRLSLELDPRFDGAHTDMARALEALGRFDEARAEFEAGRTLSGGVAGPSIGRAQLEAAAGNVAEARRMLDELIAARQTRVVSAWGIANVHAALGDVDEAFRWLDVAVEERASGLLMLRAHPRLDPIRHDPRYWPLVEKVGLGSDVRGA